MEKKLRVVKVSYSEELPEESQRWMLYLLEGMIISQLDASPQTKGELLKASDEYRKGFLK